MYASLGWLRAAENIGLLDTALYMTGLSGSTWLINPLVASGLSLKDYTAHVKKRLVTSPEEQVKQLSSEEIEKILVMLGRKYYSQQHLGVVDIFGALLTHLFLKNLYGEDIPENPYVYPFTKLQKNTRSAQYPFPISTMVLGNLDNLQAAGYKHRPTIEVSPFTIGSFEEGIGGFIPTWAFGRKFKKGSSQTIVPINLFAGEMYLAGIAMETAKQRFAPEGAAAAVQEKTGAVATSVEESFKKDFYGHQLPLGYFMGMFSSAFSADMTSILGELYNKIVPIGGTCPVGGEKPSEILQITQSILGKFIEQGIEMVPEGVKPSDPAALAKYLKDEHYAAAHTNNPYYRLPGSKLAKFKSLSLVDGGYEKFNDAALTQNLAIVPLLYRDMDVILIADSSGIISDAPALRAAQIEAKLLNKPFPEITDEQWKGIGERPATLIVDEENLEAPVIVYMPMTKNDNFDPKFDPSPKVTDFTGTLNFTYTEDQADLLMGVMYQNVDDSQDILKEAITIAAERRAKRKISYAQLIYSALEQMTLF